MTRARHPKLSLIIAVLTWLVIGLLVWKLPPTTIWLETGVLVLVAISGFLFLAWLTNSWKNGLTITVMLMGLLLLRRLRLLDLLTGGLWIGISGLITLII